MAVEPNFATRQHGIAADIAIDFDLAACSNQVASHRLGDIDGAPCGKKIVAKLALEALLLFFGHRGEGDDTTQQTQ